MIITKENGVLKYNDKVLSSYDFDLKIPNSILYLINELLQEISTDLFVRENKNIDDDGQLESHWIECVNDNGFSFIFYKFIKGINHSMDYNLIRRYYSCTSRESLFNDLTKLKAEVKKDYDYYFDNKLNFKESIVI